MSRSATEDAQPNEARPGRKGMHVVPAIRTTRQAPPFRGSYPGGRGFRISNNSNRFRGPYNEASRFPGPSEFARQPYVLPGRPSFNPYRRIPSTQDPAAEIDSRRQGYMHSRSQFQQDSKQKPRTETLIHDLPESCQKGHEGNKHHRAKWIKQKIAAIEINPGMRVVGHSYREDKALFEVQHTLQFPQTATNFSTDSSHANASSQRVKLVGLETFPGRALAGVAFAGPSREMTNPTLLKAAESAISIQPVIINEPKQVRPAPRAGNSLVDCDHDAVHESHGTEEKSSWTKPDDQITFAYTHGRTTEAIDLMELENGPDPAIVPSNLQNKAPPTVRGRPQLNRVNIECQPPAGSHIGAFLYGCFSCRSGSIVVKRQHASRDGTAGERRSMKGNSQLPSTGPRDFETHSTSNTSINQQGSHLQRKLDADAEIRQAEILDISGRKFSVTSLFEPSQGFPLPKYDKPRRLLALPNGDFLCVTAHGLMDRLKCGQERRRQRLLHAENEFGQVDDSCFLRSPDLGVGIVLGHGRERGEISLLRLEGAEVSSLATFDRPGDNGRKRGVSVVSPMIQPSMFVTGGYDHRVHLWTVSVDVSRSPARQLALTHKSAVQALLSVYDSSQKLLTAGADCVINIWDVSSERVVNSLNISNSPYQAHGTDSPFCTLLEVAHRELQFELRDRRVVPEKPVQRFGYLASQFHGRYIRGHLESSYFACGGRDGNVRLWDLRATSQPCDVVSCFLDSRAVEVVFSDGRIIACSSDYRLSAVNLSSSN